MKPQGVRADADPGVEAHLHVLGAARGGTVDDSLRDARRSIGRILQ